MLIEDVDDDPVLFSDEHARVLERLSDMLVEPERVGRRARRRRRRRCALVPPRKVRSTGEVQAALARGMVEARVGVAAGDGRDVLVDGEPARGRVGREGRGGR